MPVGRGHGILINKKHGGWTSGRLAGDLKNDFFRRRRRRFQVFWLLQHPYIQLLSCKKEKLIPQCRRLLWVMVVFVWTSTCFSVVDGDCTNTGTRSFSFLVVDHLEPQSSIAKLLLPIMPIGIVAYALTLLWDNPKCRNSCICKEWSVHILSKR